MNVEELSNGDILIKKGCASSEIYKLWLSLNSKELQELQELQNLKKEALKITAESIIKEINNKINYYISQGYIIISKEFKIIVDNVTLSTMEGLNCFFIDCADTNIDYLYTIDNEEVKYAEIFEQIFSVYKEIKQ